VQTSELRRSGETQLRSPSRRSQFDHGCVFVAITKMILRQVEPLVRCRHGLVRGRRLAHLIENVLKRPGSGRPLPSRAWTAPGRQRGLRSGATLGRKARGGIAAGCISAGRGDSCGHSIRGTIGGRSG
jgi:hypothetical protein